MELAAWVGCLFFLVAGWNQVEKFLDRRSSRSKPRDLAPQPLKVAAVDPPVTDSFCRARHQEVGAELHRLDAAMSHLRSERRADVAELQQKITKVERELGEMHTCVLLSRERLIHIDGKLDRVIERRQ